MGVSGEGLVRAADVDGDAQCRSNPSCAGTMHDSIDVSRGLGQQHGFFHAGVASAIADSACGYAAYTLAPPDTEVLTAEFKINLLAPAKGRELVATAEVIRQGRLSVCLARIEVGPDGPNGRPCAIMLATIAVVPVS